MSSNPIQYVTLVSGGGTPVRIADQKGSPYPTTGYGALVFNINPTIEGGLIVNGDIVFTGDLQGPYNSPLTTQGDLYYYGPTGNTRLPVGAAGTTLTSDGNNAFWRTGGASPGGAAGGDLDGTYPNPVLRPSLTNGQVMTTLAGIAQWANLPAGNPGTVTTISVASANGLAGTVATPTSTPAITLRITVTGMLKGNGTAISAATAGTDYVIPSGLPTTLPPSGTAGGDLNGTYPNPLLKPSLTNGQVMTTVAGVATWAAASGGGASLTISDTPPGSPTAGAMWWNSVLGTLMVYYNDGNSSQWVPATPTMAGSYLPLTGGTLTGPLTGTTAMFSGAVGVGGVPSAAKFRSSGVDGDLLGLFSGTTKGLRITTNATGTTIDGVDTTGVGSFQPLTLSGTTVSVTAPLNVTGTVMAPGAQIQMVSTETGAVATGTTIIPTDDTIPQITEGTEFMTCAITPKSATSKLIIEVCAFVCDSVASHTVAAALFQDATANALAAGCVYSSTADTQINLAFRHVMTSGTTSATTFRVRIGPHAAGTITFNGGGAARRYGGVMASSIVIREVAP